MAELQIVRTSDAVQPVRPANRSFEQERREVLESVMSALSSALPDADEMAACGYLLQHLAGIMESARRDRPAEQARAAAIRACASAFPARPNRTFRLLFFHPV